MKNLRGRAAVRGKPLDEDCKRAIITTHEYGQEDNRKFCYGICNGFPDEVAEKCIECKAYAYNAEPPVGWEEQI